jgi:hypothetical protein
MPAVNRTTVLVLVALGAALAGFAFSTAARRGGDEVATGSRSVAASPQRATLGWRESHGAAGDQLVFSVDSLEILGNGWRADLTLENRSAESYNVVSTLERPFGLMIFSSGSYDELVERNETGKLPTIRPATRYEPHLPSTLRPGETWSGTISAPGALVANGWVRVVFGGVVRAADPAEGVTWITDRAYRLKA